MDFLTIILLVLLVIAIAMDIVLFIWVKKSAPSENKEAVEAVKKLVNKVDKKNICAQSDGELIDAVHSIDIIKKLVN